jgi:DNA primase large subunit
MPASNGNAFMSSPARGEIFYEDTATIPVQYPHRLSLYTQPPAYEITVEDFESLALARLELLRAVETAGIRNLKDDELAAWIRRYEQKHLPLHGNNVAGRFPLFEERRRDEAAHYILRLAFCGAVPHDSASSSAASSPITAEDGRRWFVNQEAALLRLRLQMLSRENRAEREAFLQQALSMLVASGAVNMLTGEEKAAVAEELRCIHSLETLEDDFIKVDWELVPDLVARRAVILKRGAALVPRADAASVIVNHFKDSLESALERIAREVPFLRDDRIVPLLEALRSCDYSLDAVMSGSGSGNGLSQALAAADIDKTSVHFPLCMQQLHRALRTDNHLKFQGRQQYGLFLKSIGLSLTEALIFWRAAFAPKCNADAFAKNYSYNVRHNYGQEGKRANYTSYSCAKICASLSAPGPGEHHGCPYRYAKGEKLATALAAYTGPNGAKLSAPQIKEVSALAETTHYQLACTRVFEMTRPAGAKSGPMETISYPHKFFEASVAATTKK